MGPQGLQVPLWANLYPFRGPVGKMQKQGQMQKPKNYELTVQQLAQLICCVELIAARYEFRFSEICSVSAWQKPYLAIKGKDTQI